MSCHHCFRRNQLEFTGVQEDLLSIFWPVKSSSLSTVFWYFVRNFVFSTICFLNSMKVPNNFWHLTSLPTLDALNHEKISIMILIFFHNSRKPKKMFHLTLNTTENKISKGSSWFLLPTSIEMLQKKKQKHSHLITLKSLVCTRMCL